MYKNYDKKFVRKSYQLYKILNLIPVVQCPTPGNGNQATLTPTSDPYRYEDMASYTCDDDAAMVTRGSLSLQCGTKGQWSNEPPTCRKYCLVGSFFMNTGNYSKMSHTMLWFLLNEITS